MDAHADLLDDAVCLGSDEPAGLACRAYLDDRPGRPWRPIADALRSPAESARVTDDI
jgi:hypothetical protein